MLQLLRESENRCTLTKNLHGISHFPRRGVFFSPRLLHAFLGRPCAVQVALVSLHNILDEREHKEPEYDRGNRKDHVFDRPLTILVAEHTVTTN